MRRAEAISRLRNLLPEARRQFGVRRLALFGSTARDDARNDSDLDVLVDFESGPTFDSFVGLKLFLEDRLQGRIDLVTRDGIKPRMRPAAEQEALDV